MSYRLRGILLLLIGFVLIVAGIIAVYFLTRQAGILGNLPVQPASEASEVVLNQAVVLTHDMKLGDLIQEQDVTTAEIPTEFLPRNYVADPADAVGKFIKADLIQGEMLLQHNLADPTNSNGDLAFILSDEHILMAISVDDTMTRQAIVKRGDIIDVYVTMTQPVDVASIPGVGGETSPISEDEVAGDETDANVPRSFTFGAFQNLGITALVADIIVQDNQGNAAQRIADAAEPEPTDSLENIVVRAYLLALNPQDALVLKHLKDNGGVFDLVLRSPTSTQSFDLTPVTQEYIVELYGLEILK